MSHYGDDLTLGTERADVPLMIRRLHPMGENVLTVGDAVQDALAGGQPPHTPLWLMPERAARLTSFERVRLHEQKVTVRVIRTETF